MIKQISVMEPEFKKYGKVIGGYDLKEILQKMEETPCPDDVVYVASVKEETLRSILQSAIWYCFWQKKRK